MKSGLGLLIVTCAGAVVLGGPIARAKVGGVVVAWGEVEADYAGPMQPGARLDSLSPGDTVRNPRFTRYTDEVPARLCLRFGIAAWLTVGPGDAMPDEVKIVVTHPRLQRPDGASSTADSFYTPVIQGAVGAYFAFQQPWELQPGAWTFELRNADGVLARKTFKVIAPPEGRPSTPCEGTATS